MNLPVTFQGTYDTDANCLYINIPRGSVLKKPAGTIPVNATTMVDVDEKGLVMGIEIINYAPKKSK